LGRTGKKSAGESLVPRVRNVAFPAHIARFAELRARCRGGLRRLAIGCVARVPATVEIVPFSQHTRIRVLQLRDIPVTAGIRDKLPRDGSFGADWPGPAYPRNGHAIPATVVKFHRETFRRILC